MSAPAPSADDFLSPLRKVALKPGDQVVVRDLKSRADLNGEKGKLLSFSADRWRVEVAGGECVRVKATNLRKFQGVSSESDRLVASAAKKAEEDEAKWREAEEDEEPRIVDLGAEGEEEEPTETGKADTPQEKAQPEKGSDSKDPNGQTEKEKQDWCNRVLMMEAERGEYARVEGMLDPEETQPEKEGRMIVTKGAEVDFQDWHHWRGRTALIIAAMKGHGRTIEVLIRMGANLDKQDEDGMTALMHAVKFGEADKVVMLIDSGAKLNLEDAGGKTALIIAAMEGRTKSLIPLLNAGADAHHEDYIGFSALMWATEESHEGCIKALEERGAVV